jgi:hypothetical protein
MIVEAGAGRAARVVLLTFPGLYGALAIERFSEARPRLDLVGIGLSHRIFKGKGQVASALAMIHRTGLAYSTYSFLVTDCAWGLLRLAGRPAVLKELGNDVRHLQDVNGHESIAWLETLAPDYVVSCYFNQIIGPRVVALPRLGCVNMHPAPLPALRGPEPCFRTLQRAMGETAVTVHVVEAELDAGAIWHQERVEVPPGLTLLELSAHLWSEGARVVAAWLASPRGANPVPQPDVPVDYTTWPSPHEVRECRRTGLRLFDTGAFVRLLRHTQS